MKWTSGSRPMKQRARRWSRSVPPVASSGSGKALTPSAGVSSPTCHQTVASPQPGELGSDRGHRWERRRRAPSWMRRPRSGRSSAEIVCQCDAGQRRCSAGCRAVRGGSATRAGEVRRAGEHQPRGAGRDGGAARQSQHEDPVDVVRGVACRAARRRPGARLSSAAEHPSLRPAGVSPHATSTAMRLRGSSNVGRDQVVGHHISQRSGGCRSLHRAEVGRAGSR